MNSSFLLNGVLLVASPLFACALLERKRRRQRWSKSIFVILAIVGSVIGGGQLALDHGWLSIGEEAGGGLKSTLAAGRGLMVGLVLALALSVSCLVEGPKFTMDERPNKALEPTSGLSRLMLRMSRAIPSVAHL